VIGDKDMRFRIKDANFQSTPTFVGRAVWFRSCVGLNCCRRANARLGIDTLIVSILV